MTWLTSLQLSPADCDDVGELRLCCRACPCRRWRLRAAYEHIGADEVHKDASVGGRHLFWLGGAGHGGRRHHRLAGGCGRKSGTAEGDGESAAAKAEGHFREQGEAALAGGHEERTAIEFLDFAHGFLLGKTHRIGGTSHVRNFATTACDSRGTAVRMLRCGDGVLRGVCNRTGSAARASVSPVPDSSDTRRASALLHAAIGMRYDLSRTAVRSCRRAATRGLRTGRSAMSDAGIAQVTLLPNQGWDPRILVCGYELAYGAACCPCTCSSSSASAMSCWWIRS